MLVDCVTKFYITLGPLLFYRPFFGLLKLRFSDSTDKGVRRGLRLGEYIDVVPVDPTVDLRPDY